MLYLHVNIISWHRVPHTLSTASTKGCLMSLYFQNYKRTSECSFTFCGASWNNQSPAAHAHCELKDTVISLYSNSCALTNQSMKSLHMACHLWTPSTYRSTKNFVWHPGLHNPRVHVHQHTGSIMASYSLDHMLQPDFQSHSNTASKCISYIASLQCPSAFCC